MKNKFLVALVMMAGGLFILGFFLPWWAGPFWVIAVAAAMGLKIRQGLLAGGISYVLVWLSMAIYASGMDRFEILGKTGILLGGLSKSMLLLIVAVISLVTGLFSGWLGSVTGDLLRQKKTELK